MVSARPEPHVTLARAAYPAARPLPGRPFQAAAADEVRVGMRHVLPGVRAAVEDDAVAGIADALGEGDTVREAGHLIEEAAASQGDRRDIGTMLFWYDQDMYGGLRVDIPERDSPQGLAHSFNRSLAGSDPAK